MRKYTYVITLVLFTVLLACKKESNEKLDPPATVNVINAVVGLGQIKLNIDAGSGFYWSKAPGLDYGGYRPYSSFTGTKNIKAVTAADTNKVVFNRTIDLGTISTLYLAGQAPNVDTIFRAEKNIPFVSFENINPEFACYVRFVNMAPDSPPLSINIQSVNNAEVTGLAYKSISAFKKYPALTTTGNYIFEIRNAATTEVLATYTMDINLSRYKTVSLVITGLVNPRSISVTQANYF